MCRRVLLFAARGDKSFTKTNLLTVCITDVQLLISLEQFPTLREAVCFLLQSLETNLSQRLISSLFATSWNLQDLATNRILLYKHQSRYMHTASTNSLYMLRRISVPYLYLHDITITCCPPMDVVDGLHSF